MSDEISLAQYRSALISYISESKQIIQELISIKDFVKKNHTNVKAINTAGAAAGVGAAAVIGSSLFIPFHAAILAIGSSFAAAGGSIASIGANRLIPFLETDDGIKAKYWIEDCQKKHVSSVNRLNQETEKLRQVITLLVTKGINFDAALASTVAYLSDIGNRIDKCGKSVYDYYSLAAEIETAIESGKIQDILAPTGILLTKNLQGEISLCFPSVEAISTVTEAQSQACISISTRCEAPLRQPPITTEKLNNLVQVAFTVADVVSLIKSWNDDHPLVDSIDDYIGALRASIVDKKRELYLIQRTQIDSSSTSDIQCNIAVMILSVNCEISSLIDLKSNIGQLMMCDTDDELNLAVSQLKSQRSFMIVSSKEPSTKLLSNTQLIRYYWLTAPDQCPSSNLLNPERVTCISTMDAVIRTLYRDLGEFYRERALEALAKNQDISADELLAESIRYYEMLKKESEKRLKYYAEILKPQDNDKHKLFDATSS